MDFTFGTRARPMLIVLPLLLTVSTWPASAQEVTVATESFAVATEPVENAAAEKSLRKGRQAERDRKRSKAIRAFEKANELLGGECYECLLSIGRLHSQLAYHDRAISTLERLFSTPAGASEECADTLVDAYRNAGRRYKAVDVYRRMAEKVEEGRPAVYALNEQAYWLLLSNGDSPENLAEAETLLRRAAKLSHGEANTVRVNLAEVLHRMGVSGGPGEASPALVNDELDSPWQGLSELRISTPVARSLGLLDPDPAPDHIATSPIVGDPTKPRSWSRGMSKPRKFYAPAPRYTEAARAARIQGEVLCRVIIDHRGNVTVVEVIHGLSHGLNEEAIATLETWKFRPATLHGEPVSIYYNLNLNFRL